MAILTKTVFENPYIGIGNAHDICIACRAAYEKEHPDQYAYQIDKALYGKLDGQKVFKLFRNSNTPFILCARHLQETAMAIEKDKEA